MAHQPDRPLDRHSDHQSVREQEIQPDDQSEQQQQPQPTRCSHQLPSAEEILEVARSNDKDQLPQLLDQHGADIDIKNNDGLTALHLAVLARDPDVVDALLKHGSDIEAQTPDNTGPLLMASTLGDVEVVAMLLKHTARLAPNFLGIQPFIGAILKANIEIARLLIDYGVEAYGEELDLNQILSEAILTSPSQVGTIKVLLDRGADPDSFYNHVSTVLHCASAKGDLVTMHALLNAGANVDIRNFNGATPLFGAVTLNELAPAKMLLQHGASTHIWRSDGRSVLDLAESNPEMLELLQAETVFQGPRIKPSMSNQPEQSVTMLRPAPPPTLGERHKTVACHGFDVTMIDFFTGGEHEQMIPKRVSVHELLYSQGPEANRSQLDKRHPDFTWYHLPSNNMVWVETLIRRLAAEKGTISKETYEDTKEELELAHSEIQKSRASAGRLSTLRPQCRRVFTHVVSTPENGSDDCVVSFVPFLHAEVYSGYQRMAKVILNTGKRRRGLLKKRPTTGRQEPPLIFKEAPADTRTGADKRTGADARTSADTRTSAGTRKGADTRKGLWSYAQDGLEILRHKLAGRPRRLHSDTQSAETAPDTHRGTVEINRSPADIELVEGANQEPGILATLKDAKPFGPPAWTQKQVPQGKTSSFQDEEISNHSNNREAEKANSKTPKSPSGDINHQASPNSQEDSPELEQSIMGENKHDSESNKSASAHSLDPSKRSLRSNRNLDATTIGRTDRERISPPSKNLNDHLIRGYYKPGKLEIQARRTLDQYVYADMETRNHRDDDQVVYRYTNEYSLTGPKIFMVDQLWLWVIGKDTIITCSPLQWNSWVPRGFTLLPRHMNSSTKPGFLAFLSGAQNKSSKPPGTSKAKHKWQRYMARRDPHDPHVETWPEMNLDEPMNVHQRITKYLFKHGRGPVGSVYDLAALITTCCVDVFDPGQVHEDYLFFDFFEKSIGIVNDKVANYLREFKDTVSSLRYGDTDEDVVMDIMGETELMIEVEDILDELHTLKIVLRDQESVVGDMNKTFKEMTGHAKKPPTVETRILENHLLRIERMEEAARKANTSIHRLMDLKQKQASLAESWYARAAAKDTARQGKTVIVFTVVTILFLPVSFITSVFTIETNTFPRDKDDKIPFDYVMKCIMTIGLGLSLPFIIVAFNVDRIADFFNNPRKAWWKFIQVAVFLGIVAAIVAPVWTSKLSHSAKTAATVVLAIMILLSLIGIGMSKLVSWFMKINSRSISSGYNSQYSGSEQGA